MAICKHSLDFPIALVSFCIYTGSNVVMVQYRHLWVLGGGGSVYLGIWHAQTESRCQKYLDPLTFWANPYQNKVKWKTTPYCANLGSARSEKINKYLSGSNRERSIGEGMAVPELRTRFLKNWWENSLNTVYIKIPIHTNVVHYWYLSSGKHTETHVGFLSIRTT